MKVCLFPNVAYLSETSRAIEIFKALKMLGVNPLVATHGGTYEHILREERIPYQIVSPEMTNEQCRDYVLANIGKKRGFYQANVLREHVHSEIDFLKKNQVSLVHIGFTLSVKLSARLLHIPLSTAHGSFFPPVFEKRLVPFRKDFDVGLIRLFPDRWKRQFVNWLFPHIKAFTKAFDVVAKELGIAPIQSIADLFVGDYTFVTDTPEIIGISKDEIESWEKKKKDSRYSSPIKLILAGAIYAKLFGEVSQDLVEFFHTDKPKIFVALTSSVKDCLSRVYDTLKGMDCRAVFSTTIHPKDFEPSENILLKDHIPSHKVMPLCDLAIIHGGQGSIQTAIASSTPILGFPLQPEQNLNLQLIENHKAGFNLPFSVLKKKQLDSYISTIINDKSFSINMKRLKAWQERYNGPENVARSILEL